MVQFDPEFLRDEAFRLEQHAAWLYVLADEVEANTTLEAVAAQDNGYTPNPPSVPPVKETMERFDYVYRIGETINEASIIEQAQKDVAKGKKVKIEFTNGRPAMTMYPIKGK